MKVSIDRASCMGHGLCYMTAPQVFRDDDDGYGHVLGDGEVTAEHADDARRAAANCPERAITT